jgi:hypothetical protein
LVKRRKKEGGEREGRWRRARARRVEGGERDYVRKNWESRGEKRVEEEEERP